MHLWHKCDKTQLWSILYLYIRHILFWHICWQRFAVAALFSQIKHIHDLQKAVAEYAVLVCFGQAAHSGHSTEAHREQSCMADNIANLGGLNPGVVTNRIGWWWLSTVMAGTHPTSNMCLFYPFLSMLANILKEASFLYLSSVAKIFKQPK